jgi:hypothetical protein
MKQTRRISWFLLGLVLAFPMTGCNLFCKAKKKEASTKETSKSPSENPSSMTGEAPKHKAPDQEEIDQQKKELLKEKRKNATPQQSPPDPE